ncbi:glutamine amidotransferase [Alcanivorax sp. P2S70]|uniref:DJ-1/PfpI family protein n=1 Tax=Alcanivorax sp. P2S70 TaxID=1397527 RepID=UPI0003B69830|nr:glutamine amidotransferase [Alcanivorax sp. P2S70]MED5431933.1 DJ-1/PfpI family protein [Pseudomonadota bacterium]
MLQIGIVIYDEAEVLDFAGPYEVFATAARLCGSKPWSVSLISERKTVRARGSFPVQSHFTLDNHPPLDVLLVSGGVHTWAMNNTVLLDSLRRAARSAQWITSVCTGAFILAQAGLLTHQNVTTHWEDIDELGTRFPDLSIKENVRWVEDGNRITSAGISAGIDMSLHLVEKLHSRDLALNTAKQMDYFWES